MCVCVDICIVYVTAFRLRKSLGHGFYFNQIQIIYIYIFVYVCVNIVICPLTAELDVTPICQGCYSCFHVPLASASQVPAEGSGSGRQRGCLTGAIASRVAGKTLGAAGLECFGQGSTLQQLWFILLIIWCWEHLICNSGKLPLPVLKGAPGSFTLVAEPRAPATAFFWCLPSFEADQCLCRS